MKDNQAAYAVLKSVLSAIQTKAYLKERCMI